MHLFTQHSDCEINLIFALQGFPGGSVAKEPAGQCRRRRSWVAPIPGSERSAEQNHAIFLPLKTRQRPGQATVHGHKQT